MGEGENSVRRRLLSLVAEGTHSALSQQREVVTWEQQLLLLIFPPCEFMGLDLITTISWIVILKIRIQDPVDTRRQHLRHDCHSQRVQLLQKKTHIRTQES